MAAVWSPWHTVSDTDLLKFSCQIFLFPVHIHVFNNFSCLIDKILGFRDPRICFVWRKVVARWRNVLCNREGPEPGKAGLWRVSHRAHGALSVLRGGHICDSRRARNARRDHAIQSLRPISALRTRTGVELPERNFSLPSPSAGVRTSHQPYGKKPWPLGIGRFALLVGQAIMG